MLPLVVSLKDFATVRRLKRGRQTSSDEFRQFLSNQSQFDNLAVKSVILFYWSSGEPDGLHLKEPSLLLAKRNF